MTATILLLALFSSSIHISVDQASGLSSTELRLAIDQVQQIWQRAGVAVTSGRRGEAAIPGEAIVSLRIVGVAAPPSRRGAPVLGWTAVDKQGKPEPVLIVSLPSIAALVSSTEFAGMPVKRLTYEMRSNLIARAIGRVAAHELGHYLLEQVGHRDGGLMRPAHSARDLVVDCLDPFRLSGDEQLAMRAEIGALARSQNASLARVDRVGR